MSAITRPTVDADVHIHELNSDLAPYFDLPWRRALEEGGLAREGARSVKGERFLDYPGYSPLTPYDPILGDLPEGEPRRITCADELRQDLSQRGIGAALIYTGRLLRAATSNDHHYVAALARAYNRYLHECWADPAQGIYAAIMAPNQLPELAAGEIAAYARKDGFVAVYLPTAGNYPLWGDRSYDPIFAAAEAADLPVVLQGAITIHTVFPYELHHMPTALAKQTLSQAFGAIANLVSILTTGVLARFPRLKVVVNDAGLAWLPLVIGRLDHYHQYLREEVPFVETRPSDDVRKRVYVTTHPIDVPVDNAEYVAACLRAIGVDRLLFGSDWPHFDATTPDAIRTLPLGDDEISQILSENARTLFRIG